MIKDVFNALGDAATKGAEAIRRLVKALSPSAFREDLERSKRHAEYRRRAKARARRRRRGKRT